MARFVIVGNASHVRHTSELRKNLRSTPPEVYTITERLATQALTKVETKPQPRFAMDTRAIPLCAAKRILLKLPSNLSPKHGHSSKGAKARVYTPINTRAPGTENTPSCEKAQGEWILMMRKAQGESTLA